MSATAAAGVLSNDTFGADGASVVGVAKGTTNANLDNTGTLGAGLHGTYGTLTLNADGSYSYIRDANSAGGVTDTFTYTIKDGDGDLSHTTLTITLPDATPSYTLPTAGNGVTTVYEAGLAVRSGEPAGSHIGATNITATGVIGVSSVDGVGSVSLNGQTVTGTSAGTATTVLSNSTGTLTAWYEAATSQIHYTYTLLDNTLNTSGTSISVPVGVTDLDGDTPASGGNLVITIVDDAPVAVSDTNSLGTASVGSQASGNLIAGTITSGSGTGGADTQGADGAHIGSVTGGASDGSGGFNVAGTYGTLHVDGNGAYSYTRTSAAGGTDTFHYTLTDGDGDISNQADLTITLDDTGRLFVGSNDSDDNPNDPAHFVDVSSNVTGVINGGGGNDTIAGDPGATPTISAGSSANIVLVLDTTASLTAQQMSAMQQAVGALLNSLYNSGAANVRVSMYAFGGGYTQLGTYNIVANSHSNAAADAAALVSALDAANADGSITNSGSRLYIGADPGSNTSYADGLDAVIDYLTPGTSGGDPVSAVPLTGASVNKVIFISDGEPTTNATQTQINTITGTGAGQYGYTIEAVGLNVAGSPNAVAALNALDSGHSYTNVVNPSDLTGVVGSLAGSGVVQSAAGNDVINGGAGKDIIYGDVMNTDVLRAAAGLSAATYPAGSGWGVFAALEGTTTAFTTANDLAGDGPQWTRADTIAYIAAHQSELSKESGRTGGDDTITGGMGDDIIFAQEGNDKIYYAQGDGKDTVDGGSGSDTLYISGATGTVTIAAATVGPDIVPATGTNYTDIIVTMSDGGSIRMDSVEDIDITAGPGGVNIQYIGSLASTALDTSTVTVHGGTGDDVLDLTQRGNTDPHKVIADGGAQTTADIVKLDFSVSEITAIQAISGGVKITHAGGAGTITDEFTNFESFQFEGGVTKTLAEVQNLDLIPPTLTSITMNDTALKVGETSLVTVVFSEKVNNLEVTDFTAPGGALSNLSSADGGQTWTMTFIPTTNSTSSGNQISLANNSYTDIAGNTGSGGTSAATYSIDTKAPTVTINGDVDPVTGQQVVFDVVFSESVTGFTGADISFTGSTAPGSLSASVTGSGTTYQVTVTGMTGSGSVVASVIAGAALDAAGNASAASTSTDNAVAFTLNLPSFIIAPSDLQYDPTSSSDVTAFNRIMFSDPDTAGSVTVHLTRTSGDGTLSATSTSDVVVSGSSSDMILTGTVDAINAYLAGNKVTLDTQGNDTDVFTISIDDGTTTISQTNYTVSDVSFTSSGSANTNNYAGVNVYETSLDSGNGNDTLYTSWSHLGSSATAYAGGGGTGDTINLIFTADQLQEILSSGTTRDDLQAFLAAPTGDTLSLGSTSWRASASGFETANIQLADLYATRDTTTPSNNYFDINTTWKSVITSSELLGTNGDGNNNFIVASAAGQSLSGNGGNDVMVALNGGNTLNGGAGLDLLLGGSGSDTLIGGDGIDRLSGGGGIDHFRFNATSEAGDHIMDFVHGTDTIDLLAAAFGGGSGAIVSADLIQITDAQNPSTIDMGSAHFAYQQSTGSLYYDPNGGAADANRILLAVLDNHAALTATDVHKV
ncbi:flagellar hook-length control protein [Bradyrhizobiaceae bacterium SG-6C]|nr:flagellar hook-length control protein [Bradyrhizobiaceae bacterium SG-6C]